MDTTLLWAAGGAVIGAILGFLKLKNKVDNALFCINDKHPLKKWYALKKLS